MGLIQPSTFVAVNSYFRAKRGRAVGVSMAGTGVGQMLMPHLVRYLLDSFGFRGTAMILGALAFNGVRLSFIMVRELLILIKMYEYICSCNRFAMIFNT